jgi:hypothetical protein
VQALDKLVSHEDLEQSVYPPPQISYVVGADGALIYISAFTCRLLLKRHDELIGLHVELALRPGEDRRLQEPDNWQLPAWCREHPGRHCRFTSFLIAADGRRVSFDGDVVWQTHDPEGWVVQGVVSDQDYRRVETLPDFDRPILTRQLRAEVREAVNDHLFYEHEVARLLPSPPPLHRQRSRVLAPALFEQRLREILRELANPESFTTIQVKRVASALGILPVSLRSYLKDPHYGPYAVPGETPLATLKRLARQWFPEFFED